MYNYICIYTIYYFFKDYFWYFEVGGRWFYCTDVIWLQWALCIQLLAILHLLSDTLIPLALYLELLSGFHKGIMVKFKHSLYLSLSVP